LTLPAFASGTVSAQTKLGRTNFDSVAAPTSGTPVVYAALTLTSSLASVIFTGTGTTLALTSACSFVPGHTYSVYESTLGVQVSSQTAIAPNGHTIAASLNVPAIVTQGTAIDFSIVQN
jgi:hypothetical protein